MAGSKPLAFCDAHKAGLCSVAWLPAGGGGDGGPAAVLLTAGPDGRVCYRKEDTPSEVMKDIENSCNGAVAPVHCLAAAQGLPVLTGDDQSFVKCYSHPRGELINVATRFTLPVRALALSAGGLSLAAGGDDETIKLVDLSRLDSGSCRVIRQLQVQAYTRSIAYDPEGTYVASANADGSLNVWEVASGKQQLCRRKACPKLDLSSTSRSQLAWHPDGGSLLAAPGTDSDVVLFERMSWEPVFVLGGQHSGDVSLLAFSKNGLYLVTAGGSDQAVVLWDVNERKCLEKRLLPGCATDLAWHPTKNTLAMITEDGQLAVWEGVVPASLPGPTADVDALNGLKQKERAAGGAGPSAAAAAGMADGVSILEGAGGTAAASDDYDREDSFLADSGFKRGGKRGRRGGYGGFGLELPQPQDPIQPGSTEMGDTGRRYLAYNALGCITLRQEEDHNVVEVSFHDTSRMRKRIPLLNDFFSFNLGSLGDRGALYASRSNRESASTVVYRPYESWAANSEWTLSLPKGEEAECAAAGSSFCAIATSRRHLRLFSQAGTQTHLLTLPGAPVALVARGHQLAAVWHGAAPTTSGDQCLQYALYDVAEQRQLHSGPLPLSPGSTLAWLGFSEEGLLAAYDTEGEVRVRSADFGGCWVTVFSAVAERKSTEQYWVVGLSAKEMQTIVCANSPEPAVPSGMARPVVTVVPLRAPVVAQDGATAPFEADLIRHGALLSHLAASAADARDAEAGDLEAALHTAQLEADRISLRLIQKLLAGERHARALEAASTLHNMPALEGALKLANHHRATALAERISMLIEQRLEMEAEAAELAEEEGQYHADLPGHGGQRQHGAVTPVPGPTFTDAQQASPAAAGTAGNMSRAPSPMGRPALAGGIGGGVAAMIGGASGNPFARKQSVHNEQPENSPGNAASAAVAAAAAKRKAPASSGNPFARKAKAAKP